MPDQRQLGSMERMVIEHSYLRLWSRNEIEEL
jgi:hypothetical protein